MSDHFDGVSSDELRELFSDEVPMRPDRPRPTQGEGRRDTSRQPRPEEQDADLNLFRIQGHSPERVYLYASDGGEVMLAKARFAPGTLKKAQKSFRWFQRVG